jgi:glycosyltransferase involved in cell wall biosynthesis
VIVLHLTASRFFGGPERQMLELAREMAPRHRSVFVSFSETGCCHDFLNRARSSGFEALALRHDTPRLLRALRELADVLDDVRPDVILCHGYKSNLLGRRAARAVGVPAVAVSRGWTGETLRVQLYEAIDRRTLRRMDRVVCVSQAQADKVRGTGVPDDRVVVIPNAIRASRFAEPDPTNRAEMCAWFPSAKEQIVGAAGRLSPEKGFEVLVDAAATVCRKYPATGFVLFGEGARREALVRQIADRELQDSFVLAGFRSDLDRFLPLFDWLAVPSYTEGLPNIVLEAFAAGVPVVASAVGGIPELIDDGKSGYLVPPKDSNALAGRLLEGLASAQHRDAMGQHGRGRVMEQFTFGAQSRSYEQLFAQLANEERRDCNQKSVIASSSDVGMPA